MFKRIPIACLVASLFVLVAAPAFADEPAAPAKEAKAAVTKDAKDAKAKNYGYTFEDDPLDANLSGTLGFVLKIRPKGAREILLRPRASFVPEMLKSVEAL